MNDDAIAASRDAEQRLHVTSEDKIHGTRSPVRCSAVEQNVDRSSREKDP
jgi:hypothetical protein